MNCIRCTNTPVVTGDEARLPMVELLGKTIVIPFKTVVSLSASRSVACVCLPVVMDTAEVELRVIDSSFSSTIDKSLRLLLLKNVPVPPPPHFLR